jgi:hypothetical protein
MIVTRTLLFMLATTLVVAPATGQQRPDLTGTWVATKDTPASSGLAPSAVFGQQFALRHDGQMLTLTRRVRETTMATMHPLDGSEVRSRVPGSLCMADAELVETAAWEGTGIAMTILGRVPPGGGAVAKASVKRLLRLVSADTLVVEGSMRDGPQTAAPRAVGTVYKRSSDSMSATVPTTAKTAATIGQLAWLSGVWTGASGSEERWTPAASGAMLGVSRTLSSGVVSAFEFLCIVARGGGLVYQAMPNGRSPATDFTLTKIEPTSATFENPAHDFPKMIRYSQLADGTLEAVVSGDPKQKAITFTFKKEEKR